MMKCQNLIVRRIIRVRREGREFSSCSVRQWIVAKSSSVILRPFKRGKWPVYMSSPSAPKNPRNVALLQGWMSKQSSWQNFSCKSQFCHIDANCFSSLFAPTKLVPLSLQMIDGWPRLVINCVTALRQEPVSSDYTQASIDTHTSFQCLSHVIHLYGPKITDSNISKGKSSCSTVAVGASATIGA